MSFLSLPERTSAGWPEFRSCLAKRKSPSRDQSLESCYVLSKSGVLFWRLRKALLSDTADTDAATRVQLAGAAADGGSERRGSRELLVVAEQRRNAAAAAQQTEEQERQQRAAPRGLAARGEGGNAAALTRGAAVQRGRRRSAQRRERWRAWRREQWRREYGQCKQRRRSCGADSGGRRWRVSSRERHRSVGGRSAGGRSADGRSAGGRSADGRSAGGRSADGRSAGVRSAGVRSAGGRSPAVHARRRTTALEQQPDARHDRARDNRGGCGAA
jgi:hypothetical protein